MSRYAYASYLIRNDSYLPGALLLAHGLREQETPADLVCLITPDITVRAECVLRELYDRVIRVKPIVLDCVADQRRQHVCAVMSRVNALRLGTDGDLGCRYEKLVLIDADVLPIRCFDHLFCVDAPAGILNERKEHLQRTDESGRFVCDAEDIDKGRWQWHHVYRRMPHGWPIPATVTDQVAQDVTNYGINTAILVLNPSMTEYECIVTELTDRTGFYPLLSQFRWPDMQYLTLHFSGRWHNIDACFAGLCGYPDVSVLFGTHFAGPKPWQLSNVSVARCYSRFPDFRRWYHEFDRMMSTYRMLGRVPQLMRLWEHIVSEDYVNTSSMRVTSSSTSSCSR